MYAFSGKDFLTLKGLGRADLEYLFDSARAMETILSSRTRTNLLADKLLGLAFFQVSTRTRMSFESAMQRLGGGVVGFADPKTTRAGDYYAESLQDVVRMMESYSDMLVIRHPKDGAPAEAAAATDIPVINAGDGYNEHPTQGLLDAYTIFREKGRLEGLQIAMVGDMNMRVMHSLPLALAAFCPQLYFVSPKEQAQPENWQAEYRKVGLRYEERENLDGILPDLDVIYLMGTKTPSYAHGRVDAVVDHEPTPRPYIIDREKLEKAKKDLIVLHPLPRADELPVEIDAMGAARYFVQAHYGVAVRMALLAAIMGRIP
jgi:aspartate carbamoyltransferase catalytic subunit